MKTGRTIQEISQQILSENQAKKDYVINTPVLEAEPLQEGGIQLAFNVGAERRAYKPTELCIDQIGDRLRIPRKYIDRMQAEAPGLLAQNLNHWFKNAPERRMLRTLNNGANVARAFLSEKYRTLDNFDMANIVLPRLKAAGCTVHSCEITEKRFYIQASTDRIQSIIDQNVKIGTHQSIRRTVQAGVIIGNSEVGCGSIFVDPIMYDLVCTNGMILERTLKRHHVGKRNEGEIFGDDGSYELFTDETRKLDDKAFWSKVVDVVDASLDEIKFNQNIDRLRKTLEVTLAEKPKEVEQVVEVVAKRHDFNDDEKGSVLLHFAQGGDFSAYGLINAVTRAAEDVESYDRAVELERLGGVLLLENEWSAFKKN